MSRNRRSICCEVCGLIFLKHAERNKHLIKVHSENLDYSCDACHISFATSNALSIHIDKHNPKLCKFCNKSFFSEKKLSQHTENEHLHLQQDASVNVFVCAVCNRSFRKPYLLKFHMLNQHLKNESITCPICSKGFENNKTYKEHKKSHAKECSSRRSVIKHKYTKVHATTAIMNSTSSHLDSLLEVINDEVSKSNNDLNINGTPVFGLKRCGSLLEQALTTSLSTVSSSQDLNNSITITKSVSVLNKDGSLLEKALTKALHSPSIASSQVITDHITKSAVSISNNIGSTHIPHLQSNFMNVNKGISIPQSPLSQLLSDGTFSTPNNSFLHLGHESMAYMQHLLSVDSLYNQDCTSKSISKSQHLSTIDSHTSTPFTCQYCFVCLMSKESYDLHLQEHFPFSNTTHCDSTLSKPNKPNQTLSNSNELGFLENLQNGRFVCPFPFCNNDYSSRNSCLRHWKKSCSNRVLYTCNICKDQFLQNRDLLAHTMTVHMTIENAYKDVGSSLPSPPNFSNLCAAYLNDL